MRASSALYVQHIHSFIPSYLCTQLTAAGSLIQPWPPSSPSAQQEGQQSRCFCYLVPAQNRRSRARARGRSRTSAQGKVKDESIIAYHSVTTKHLCKIHGSGPLDPGLSSARSMFEDPLQSTYARSMSRILYKIHVPTGSIPKSRPKSKSIFPPPLHSHPLLPCCLAAAQVALRRSMPKAKVEVEVDRSHPLLHMSLPQRNPSPKSNQYTGKSKMRLS